MGHGSHWESVTGSAEDAIKEWIPTVIQKGTMVGESTFLFDDGEYPPRLEKCFGIVYPGDSMRFLALISTNSLSDPKSNFLFSAFPFPHDGPVNSIEIDSVEDWCNPIEGIVEGTTKGGASVSFFDPFYFLNKSRYRNGDSADFIITALAYRLQPCEQQEIQIDGGPLLEEERKRVLEQNPDADVTEIKSVSVSLEEACWLMSTDVKDDFEFRGIPESVEPLKVGGVKFYKVTMVLIRPDDIDFRVAVYASEAILGGFVPRVGQSIEGFLWLQGRLAALDQ
ncbi:MAG: hypothetical protein SFU53_14940 [Terrimicrobiaceae bacterium]|nr:hypothetical protein [Terrimicrobiaceae bacterium]